MLPITLTHLNFGYCYDKQLQNFNNLINLTHLTFGHDFNQILDIKLLPPKLTYLELGICFNQPLNLIGLNLKELVISSNYNQNIQYNDCELRYVNY